jgi:cyanophycinase
MRSRTLFTWLLCTLVAHAASAGETPEFRRYVVGNALDVVRPTRGLVVLQGGGDDVDENYVQMGRLAGGGDFVVLRASGEDDYNPYIYALCDCDSVETIVFENREAAYIPLIAEQIRNAEALFIAGGDQSRYVRFWEGTPVEDAIHAVAAKPAPIGGTSAGMAILGEYAYSAMSDESLTSAVALADPYARDVTLERDFIALDVMQGIITDQHFQERDRMGRTLTFLARLVADGWTTRPRAIAADRETALHVDPLTGVGTVYATADHPTPFVWFLDTTGPPAVCAPGTPLTIEHIEVFRVGRGGRFDLKRWAGDDQGIRYTLSVQAGAIASSRDDTY